MLGHASATMTLDTYGHLFEDRLDEVSAAMEAARAARQHRTASTAEKASTTPITQNLREIRVKTRSGLRQRKPSDLHFCRSEGLLGEYPRPDSNRRYRLERAAGARCVVAGQRSTSGSARDNFCTHSAPSGAPRLALLLTSSVCSRAMTLRAKGPGRASLDASPATYRGFRVTGRSPSKRRSGQNGLIPFRIGSRAAGHPPSGQATLASRRSCAKGVGSPSWSSTVRCVGWAGLPERLGATKAASSPAALAILYRLLLRRARSVQHVSRS